MATRNCPICSRVFNCNEQNEVCPNCKESYENDFERVRDYLYEHPNQNIIEVSNATGVSIEKIKRFLRNDRLVAVDNANATLLCCKRCGKAISSGLYCEECSRFVDSGKKGNYAGSPSMSGTKMYSRNSGKR